MKGMTLLEVLIAMGIMMVAGVLLVAVIIQSTGLFSSQSAKVSEGLNINDSLGTIKGSIKQANAVAASYVDGGTTYTSGPNQLILKVVSIDASNSIIPDTFDFFIFYIGQGILRFKIYPDPVSFRKASEKVISTLTDSINFQYFNAATPPLEVPPDNASKVRISLTLKQKNGLNFVTNTATTEANLKND